MEEHTLGAGFYTITVGICRTDRILYDSINKKIEVPAKLDNDGKECIFPPGLKNGLYPGVRRGGMWVIRPKDARPKLI